MKILIIHCRYQLHGGEDTVAEQEVNLLRQNYSVEVLYFQNKKGWRGALQFLGSIWNFKSSKKVKQKINKFQPDVIHVHNWHFALGPLVFRDVNKLKIPVVHTIHNYRLLCPSGVLLHKGKLFTESLSEFFPWSAVIKGVYRSSVVQTFWLAFIIWFHKKIGTWTKIDSYVCLTAFSVELFQKSNFGIENRKFIVKPNFTKEQNSLIGIKKEKHFLFIGRLSEEKGIKILLNAFKGSSYLLKIVGDGPLRELVLDAVKDNKNISYLGSLKSDEITSELLKTQALIFPSIWYETFGLVMIESFSNFTPVLASNIGAPTSLVINNYNGFHFEVNNVEKLRETIKLFDELTEEEKNKMGNNAFKEYQKKYAPNLQIDFLDSIYSNALEKKYNE